MSFLYRGRLGSRWFLWLFFFLFFVSLLVIHVAKSEFLHLYIYIHTQTPTFVRLEICADEKFRVEIFSYRNRLICCQLEDIDEFAQCHTRVYAANNPIQSKTKHWIHFDFSFVYYLTLTVNLIPIYMKTVSGMNEPLVAICSVHFMNTSEFRWMFQNFG